MGNRQGVYINNWNTFVSNEQWMQMSASIAKIQSVRCGVFSSAVGACTL